MADITAILNEIKALKAQVDLLNTRVARLPQPWRDPRNGRVYLVAGGYKVYIPSKRVQGGHVIAGILSGSPARDADSEWLDSLPTIKGA